MIYQMRMSGLFCGEMIPSKRHGWWRGWMCLFIIDSLENIGSNKVLAVFGRTDAKDFIDLYWMLQQTDLRFDDLCGQARQKDTGLSELYLAYALQNVVKIRMFPRMLQPLPWDEVDAFFQSLAREMLLKIKPG
jgi:hypothetical protein